ncbi:hypothetical protein [Clostridium sp. N3C]|uniref:hypothetical protein n=1 Tax=Clostridium sp. N3C TaxID=1776758 RepID=UPI000942FF5D|nr:hypothetical protein [Clostridium sp. N3C]
MIDGKLFIKYNESTIATGIIEVEKRERIGNIYLKVCEKIEVGNLKNALEIIFDFIPYGN